MLFRRSLLSATCATLLLAAAAQAQQPAAHIGYIYPAGGQQGGKVRITVGGQFLDGVSKALFSGDGLQATVMEHTKPLTNNQFNKLRERLQELGKKRKNLSAEELKEVQEIREKIANYVKRPPNPAIAETVTLDVSIAADAPLGHHELRLHSTLGLSNPLVFCVSQLPEFLEKHAGGAEPMEITLPAVINGQIIPGDGNALGRNFFKKAADAYIPGDVDRYRFKARKGQNLVVAASARELVPYLADAVPGWFQATLGLYDAAGNELAYDDDFKFHPDPVLFYRVLKDGEYTIEIKDAIYRGRPDFVYRITIGELPFVTGMFPLGGPAGQKTTVDLKGWNLPNKTFSFDAQSKAPGVYPFTLRRGSYVSNSVPFAVDDIPEVVDSGANDTLAAAQRVTPPVIISGRINRPGDWDVFRFEGRAGQELVAEVTARRLDSPLDSALRLTDAQGKQIAFNDDHEDKGSGLDTHHADSFLQLKLPADGPYYLQVGDMQGNGGEEYSYRLRISPPLPDFTLRITPPSVNLRAGMSVPLTVYALRKDGFTGEIALALKDPPKGLALSGGAVPAGQDQARLTLTASPTMGSECVSLTVEGRAVLNGHEVRHLCLPADDMMQAFAYHHLVPTQEMLASIKAAPRADSLARFGKRGPPSEGDGEEVQGWLRILNRLPIKIPEGGTLEVRVGIPPVPMKSDLDLDLSDPPEGIELQKVVPTAEGLTMVLAADGDKAKAGLKGNLIVTAALKRDKGDKKSKAGKAMKFTFGSLPAIPFEVVNP